jgi:hypothetical protein
LLAHPAFVCLVYPCPAKSGAIHRVRLTIYAYVMSISPRLAALLLPVAYLVVQLVAAGHSPESAESWAAGCPAWTEADPKTIDAFAAATLRMYRRRAERNPDTPWLAAMVHAVQDWADYRETPAGFRVRPISPRPDQPRPFR